jgi:hypothetical protein
MVYRQAPYMNIGMMLHLYGQSSKVLGTQSNLRKGKGQTSLKKLQTSLRFARKHGLMK